MTNQLIEEIEKEIMQYLDVRYPNVERWKYEIYVKSFALWHSKALLEVQQEERKKWEKENTQLGTLFGVDLFIRTKDKKIVKACENYIKELTEYKPTELEEEIEKIINKV